MSTKKLRLYFDRKNESTSFIFEDEDGKRYTRNEFIDYLIHELEVGNDVNIFDGESDTIYVDSVDSFVSWMKKIDKKR